MFSLFKNNTSRVKIEGNNIFIDNKGSNIGKSRDIDFVFELSQPIPEIKVFENEDIVRCYKVETLSENSDLTDQFLHSSIRILRNSAVMIDGIISGSKVSCPGWTDKNYEAIRCLPFFLSNKAEVNEQLIGKGLFERGLHFSGTITPSSVRNICICDGCNYSFSIQHFHAGFSEVQYFYSSDSAETLIVPYGAIANLPSQLQNDIDDSILESIESKLPVPGNGVGAFRFYNSFRCPNCLSAFIDFENNREIRPGEYYGNVHINKKPKYWPEKIT